MFEHILVPLDGSHLAEAALPAARFLAQTLSARVTLLHVLERDAPVEIHGEPHLTSENEAHAYLTDVAQRAFPVGMALEKHVHTPVITDVAESIVAHTAEHHADLVVMCVHGYGGMRSWLFGSIAQQVIAAGQIPTLVIQPLDSGEPADFQCRQVLVALDGNPEHEAGLPLATDLARVCGASVHLVMVIETPDTLTGVRAAAARFLPATMSALLDLDEDSGMSYLQKHIEALKASGLSVTATVSRGDPTQRIVEAADDVAADLIVLGTHGSKGFDAFWLGSVPPKIAHRSKVPLLLVRVNPASSGS